MTIKDFGSYLWGIFTGIVFTAAVWCAVSLVKPVGGSLDNPYEEIIQQQRDSLNAQIRSLEFKFQATEFEKSTLRQRIFTLEQELIRIKKSYEKNIDSIGFYTNPECEQFFADRYGHE